jgi:hypothetical protein
MRVNRPHAAVWLDIPRGCQLQASFTADFDIEVMFGLPKDEVNVIFERSTLHRLVAIVSELLAAAEPGEGKVGVPEMEAAAS